MKFSQSINHAIKACIEIAQSDVVVRSSYIAHAHHIPIEYLLKLLQDLVKARVLNSKRGPGGGFTLARKPSEITLLEIVEAVNGPIWEEIESDAAFAGKWAKATKAWKKVMNCKLSSLI